MKSTGLFLILNDSLEFVISNNVYITSSINRKILLNKWELLGYLLRHSLPDSSELKHARSI